MSILKLNNNSLTSVTELPSGVGSDPNTKVSLARLGLRVFANQNLATSNTQNLSYDVFQDSTGIQNLTNSKRNQNEYLTSETDVLGSESLLLDADNQSLSSVASGTFDTNLIQAQNWSMVDDATHTNHQGHYNTAGNRYQNTLWGIFAGSGQQGNTSNAYFGQYTATSNSDVFYAWDTSTTSPNWVWTKFVFDRIWTSGTPNITLSGSNDLTGSWSVIKTIENLSTAQGTNSSDSGSFSNTNEYRYYQFKIHNITETPTDVGIMSCKIYGKLITQTYNATGSFEGVDITAPSSVSKMGAVITYEETGTNVLNTDIVMKLSADSGSNFTTATLEALPDFASGVKCAKISDTSVTPGTACTYQLNFANQSSGVKEAKITGVALTF